MGREVEFLGQPELVRLAGLVPVWVRLAQEFLVVRGFLAEPQDQRQGLAGLAQVLVQLLVVTKIIFLEEISLVDIVENGLMLANIRLENKEAAWI